MGAGGGGGGLGAAGHFADKLNGVRAFPHHADDGAGSKIFLEILENFGGNFERVFGRRSKPARAVVVDSLLSGHPTPVRVERIVPFHLLLGRYGHFEADELESETLVATHDFSDERPLDTVGLDNDERTLFARMFFHERQCSTLF